MIVYAKSPKSVAELWTTLYKCIKQEKELIL